MQIIENEAVVTAPDQAEIAPPAATGNYSAVRFNAMTHGILSRYTVCLMRMPTSIGRCWRH